MPGPIRPAGGGCYSKALIDTQPAQTMTIRQLLLVAFLSLTLLASCLLAGWSFFAARSALATEIGRNLGKDAALLMEQVDMLLFERLQNVHSWSHLDIMQESRVGDVDKRLARFLADIRHGYGDMYRELFYLDRGGRVIASSDPAAIGGTYLPQPTWAGTSVPGGEVFLEVPQLLPPYATADLLIRAPVHDPYGGADIGQLYGAFDLRLIFRLFDQAEQAAAGRRLVVLLDHHGKLIAASSSLRQRGLLLSDDFADWHPEEGTLLVPEHAPGAAGEVLAGYAKSRGYQGYPGLGWSLLVFQPAEQAFQPVRSLLWLFCIAFAVTGLLAGWAAHRVAGRIARPLVGLTAWAEAFIRNGVQVAPKLEGTREVRELSATFGQMIASLEHSRQQVIHAAKLAVVGEMAAIMAHEVRTPLGILYTSAQMLRREPGLSPEGQEMTRLLLDESTRLERLISTLLECARPRPPRLREQDAHAILRRAADLLANQARKKSIAIEWTLTPEPAVVACDEELLMQVFLNLILNAIQITPAGGRVGLGSHAQGRGLAITVQDNGPGIAPEQRARVFDPFYTTREGGIGLGLTVTQQIVAAHGGDIAVEVSDWGGARFRVWLPYGAQQAVTP